MSAERSDPRPAPLSRTEAVCEAWDWIMGRRSHLNEFLTIDSRAENRTLVLAHVAMADAAEATRALAVIQAMRSRRSA